jgi:hypothetical protein
MGSGSRPERGYHPSSPGGFPPGEGAGQNSTGGGTASGSHQSGSGSTSGCRCWRWARSSSGLGARYAQYGQGSPSGTLRSSRKARSRRAPSAWFYPQAASPTPTDRRGGLGWWLPPRDRHQELIAATVAARGGRVIKTQGEGDSTLSVFTRASDAVAAALAMQLALDRERWPEPITLPTRAALHTGEAELRDQDYFGQALNRAARLRALGQGGQVLLSRATAELVADQLPHGASLVDVGSHASRACPGPSTSSRSPIPSWPLPCRPWPCGPSTRTRWPSSAAAPSGPSSGPRSTAPWAARASWSSSAARPGSARRAWPRRSAPRPALVSQGGLGPLPGRGGGARVLALAAGAARLWRRPSAGRGRRRARPGRRRARAAPARAGRAGRVPAARGLAYEEAAGHYQRALRAQELQARPVEAERCELLLELAAARMAARRARGGPGPLPAGGGGGQADGRRPAARPGRLRPGPGVHRRQRRRAGDRPPRGDPGRAWRGRQHPQGPGAGPAGQGAGVLTGCGPAGRAQPGGRGHGRADGRPCLAGGRALRAPHGHLGARQPPGTPGRGHRGGAAGRGRRRPGDGPARPRLPAGQPAGAG